MSNRTIVKFYLALFLLALIIDAWRRQQDSFIIQQRVKADDGTRYTVDQFRDMVRG